MIKTFNMINRLLIVAAILFAGAFTLLVMAYKSNQSYPSLGSHTYETDDTSFKNGEILYPDYVHIDTLVVTNAMYLNCAMQSPDIASDGDIAEILNEGTELYKKDHQ